MLEERAARAWADFCQNDKDCPNVRQLAVGSRLVEFAAGTNLIEQADTAKSVYLLLDGCVSIIRFTENGHNIWLANAHIGELVGEISVLARMETTSQVVADGQVSVLSIARGLFEECVRNDPALAFALSRMLARRLAETSSQLSELIALPVVLRLHAELVRIGQPANEDAEQYIVSPAPSVSTLGARIHATREAASRALGLLERRKLVARQADAWTVIAAEN